jgi:hypothetical protein
MSRGPGSVEQVIRTAFTENGSRTFTVDELVMLAYPGLNGIEKKHRVSVLRAASKAAAVAAGWWWQQSAQPGHAVTYYNPVDVRSYAINKLRQDFLVARRPRESWSGPVQRPRPPFRLWKGVSPQREAPGIPPSTSQVRRAPLCQIGRHPVQIRQTLT